MHALVAAGLHHVGHERVLANQQHPGAERGHHALHVQVLIEPVSEIMPERSGKFRYVTSHAIP